MGGINYETNRITDWRLVGRVSDDKCIIEDYRQVDWIRTGEYVMR